MQVKYLPKLKDDYSPIAGQDVAFAILTPDVPRSKYILEIAIHGVGERSAGIKANLENLVLGFDYNNDGIRDSGFVTNDMKKAVDQYGLIMVIPTYETNAFFEPSKINYVYDYIKTNYPIYDKMILTGFSYGGGAVFKYITSSLANAQRVAYAIPCAAVSSIVDATIPGKVNLPIHAFSNDNDPTVNVSNTKNQVNAINASNPTIKAIYTIFRKDGHGSNIEAWSLTPPKAPGGQGFIDAGENIYDVATDIVKNGPRQMKSGSTTSTTTTTTRPPVTTTSTTTTTTQAPVPTLTANAGDDQTVRLPIAFLDGTRSTGYKSAQWKMKQAPVGVSIWHPVVESGGWITTKLNFPKEGTYVITLRVFSGAGYTGVIAEDDVVINYTTLGTPPEKILLQKVFIPKTGNYVYVYDDGSVETKPE